MSDLISTVRQICENLCRKNEPYPFKHRQIYENLEVMRVPLLKVC